MPLANNPYKGKFITFEGVDGAGKSSLIKLTSEFLVSMNIDVHTAFTPSNDVRNMEYWKEYSSPETNRSNFDPFGLDMIAFADRLLWQNRYLEPTLSKGVWVLCDRYLLNSLVYNQHKIFIDLLPYALGPNLGFVVTADITLVNQRIQKRGERENKDDISEKSMLNDRYILLGKKNEYVLVDTSNKSIEQSFDEILPQLCNLL